MQLNWGQLDQNKRYEKPSHVYMYTENEDLQ